MASYEAVKMSHTKFAYLNLHLWVADSKERQRACVRWMEAARGSQNWTSGNEEKENQLVEISVQLMHVWSGFS